MFNTNMLHQFKVVTLLMIWQVAFLIRVVWTSSDTENDEAVTIFDEIDLNEENIDGDDKELRAFLEEKYKFRNDNTSRRFKVTYGEKPFSEQREHQFAMVFRAFAVRRIVGGMQTTIKLYPYNVAISRNGKHWCGGSLVDEQWVLSAGHCMESAHDGDKKKLVPFIVRAGSSFHNRGGYQARVNKVFFPKEYAPGGADFDYSLLRLDRPMPIGKSIAVLNLPSRNYRIRSDDVMIVTGWGSTDSSGYGNIPARLRFVPVPVMDVQKCQESYNFYITPRMVCAGYATGGRDACNHDSGGPAVRDGVLIGVVSFGGKKCGDPRSPGVYSRVSEITEWVEKTITRNEAYRVPELKEKIRKARKREKDLQTFKTQVENKKQKLRAWLRDMLRSPIFIKLAQRKLEELGLKISTARRFEFKPAHILNDEKLDEINLSNLIRDRIIDYDSGDEAEKLLRMFALYEVVTKDESYESSLRTQAMGNPLLTILAIHNK